MSTEKALIINTATNEHIPVMYNPEEYSLDQANTFAEIGIPGLETPPIQYVRGNLRTLKLELFFDSYEKKEDVRNYTRKIVALLEKNAATKAPPVLLFSWGQQNFKCVLDSVNQKFTVFLNNGMPARATLSATFKEYKPVDIEIRRGLFTGTPAVRTILEGETLSGIAGAAMGDPGAWREIAELNNIDDPRKLQPGIQLIIPSGKKLSQPA